ncbi:MAG: hypothetical protein R6V75_11730 [Bacteroidales bacterium]
METISRNNYEAWFIDYLDGQLDGGQVDQLLDFLNENTDLRMELEEAAGMRLIPGDDQLDNKDDLKYDGLDIPGVPHTDHRCIARMEGDLSQAESDLFDGELGGNQKLAGQYAAYLQTRLAADSAVRYPDHAQLKRKTRALGNWWVSIASIAAVLVLALFLWPQRGEEAGSLATTGDAPLETNIQGEAPISEPPVSQEPSVSLASLTPIPAKALKKTAPRTETIKETNPVEREVNRIEPLTAKVPLPGSTIPNPLSSPVLYASAATPQAPAANQDEYLTVPQLALNFFRERVLGQDPELVKQTRFTIWEVADAGINRIGSLVGSSAELNRQYGQDGDLVAISFNSRLVGVETPVRSKK